MLMDAATGLKQGTPEPDDIVERMKMAAAPVEQAALIERGGDPGMKRGRIEQARLVVTVGFELVAFAGQRLEMSRFRGADDMPGRKIAVDLVGGDALPQQGLSFLGNGEADLGIATAEQTFELAHSGGITGHDLAAIAPRCAMAELAAVQHRNGITARRELERRRQAGQPCADHRDIGSRFAPERRQVRIGRRRRPIIALAIERTRSTVIHCFSSSSPTGRRATMGRRIVIPAIDSFQVYHVFDKLRGIPLEQRHR